MTAPPLLCLLSNPSFAKQEHTYIHENLLLGLIFNHSILSPKLRTTGSVDVPLRCPTQAFLSAVLVSLAWAGILDWAAELPATKPNGGTGLPRRCRPCNFSVCVGSRSHVLHFCWGPITCWIFICPKDYLVILRNPGSLANFSPLAWVPSGECDWPLLPSEGAWTLIKLEASR